jgi:ABC-type branched-subunit amino acid transport system ATPase component
LKWDTVIEQKVVEFARYLAGKSAMLDFAEPSPILNRSDDRRVRNQILGLSQAHAQTLGVRKSTLHYLRKAAQGNDGFRVYSKTRIRLDL